VLYIVCLYAYIYVYGRTALVVGSDGRSDDAEGEVRRGAESELLAMAEEERAQVHGATVAVGGY